MKHTKKMSMRVLSVLLAVLMLGSAMSAVAASLGDVDGNSSINAVDATRVLLYSVGKIGLDDAKFNAADVSGDGKVNAADATLILLHVVGKKPISGGAAGEADTDGGLLSVKKGVAASRYGNAAKDAESMAKLEELGVGWYYNWSFPLYQPESSIEAVAQVWGGAPNISTVNYYKKLAEKGGAYKNILGFNEPDLAEQAGLTVEEAIDSWDMVMELGEALGARLGSPAPASYGSGGWLDQFLQKAEELDYRVDFIALHCYQMFGNLKNVDNLKSMLTSLYDKHQMPIWLTEFGAIDTSAWYGSANPLCTEENAVLYCTAACEMLESLGFIERYAWFVDNYNEHGDSRPKEGLYSALFNDDDTISLTGEAYAAIQSTTGMIVKTTSLPKLTPGEKYSAKIDVAGGVKPYTFSAEQLPEGLQLDMTTGEITGTPTGVGSYKSIIYITDANGQETHYTYNMLEAKEALLSKTGWTAAYSKFLGQSPWFEDFAAQELVDGNNSTSYTMTRTLTTNDMFKIDMKSQKEITKLVFTGKGSVPADYKVQCLDNGGNWKDYGYKATVSGSKITLTFDEPVATSGFMIQSKVSDDSFSWEMAEVDVYGIT